MTRTLAFVVISCLLLNPQVNGENIRAIAVAGYGELETEPDIAQVTFGVTFIGDDVMRMKRQVDDTMSKLLALTSELEIKQQDVSATQLSVSPQYNNYQSGDAKITGYETTRGVIITLRDLSKLNELLDGAIKAGANRVDSIQLTTSKFNEFNERALMLAIADAKKRAETVAAGFGSKIGPVQSIKAGRGNAIGEHPLIEGLSGTSYQPGRIEINQEIIVEFQLN